MSARTALLAALLAASLAPAARAVALSISKPSQYRFVVPVETNRLTGVGMGTDAPSDAPLRYEDAAFLAELYAERSSCVTSLGRGDRNIYGRLGSLNAAYMHNSLLRFDTLPFRYPYGDFVMPSASMADRPVRATLYEASTADAERTGRLFADIFGGHDPFVRARTNLYAAVGYGMPLAADVIAELYADAEKLTRPAIPVYTANVGTSVTHSVVKKTYSTFIRDYSSIDNAFVYGDDYGPIESSETAGGYSWQRSATYKAGRRKCAVWEYDSQKDEWKSVKPVTESHYTESQEYLSYPSDGIAWLNIGESLKDVLAGATLKGVSVFARYWFNYTMYSKDATPSKTGGTFLYPVAGPCVFSDGRLAVALGGDEWKAVVNSAFSLFGVTYVGSAEKLLASVEEPPALPKHTDESWLSTDTWRESIYSVSFSGEFLVVLDVEFNARVTGGGE